MKKIIWISWEHHRRTIELCSEFNFPLFEVVSNRLKFFRQAIACFKTFRIIYDYRPCVVITQNPSYVLNLLAILLKPIYGYSLVVDQHNEGVEPYKYQFYLYRWASRLIQRRADLNIVTNRNLESIVRNNGGRVISLHDRLPRFPVKTKIDLKGKMNFVFICTFSLDEPYSDVLEAASWFNEEIHIYVTGNFNKAISPMKIRMYKNITFTGFLPEQDYINLLYSSDAIIDLTMRDNCLVCGAYEAVSLEKPLITSDTEVLRCLFNKGVIYSKNNKDDLIQCLKILIKNIKILNTEVSTLHAEIDHAWLISSAEVKTKIESYSKIHISLTGC